MNTLFIKNEFAYDGSQLRSLYAYLEHRLLGPSIISWIGSCSIPFEHMADGEDLLAQSPIQGDKMLHFIIEVFDKDLFAGVSLQRLFASICKDYVESRSKNPQIKSLRRDGDDIYFNKQKLSISIASRSPVSIMIHFAMNITNEGTPVSTLCLNDLNLDPHTTAQDLMSLFQKEYMEIVEATQKVRPLP